MPNFDVKFNYTTSTRNTLRALENGQIPWPMRPRMTYHQAVDVGDVAWSAGLTHTVALNTLFTRNVFPEDCDLLAGATIENLVLPVGAGITSITVQLGDTGDPNGLLTASNLLGGGAAVGDILSTPGAAQYANRSETAYAPEVLVTAVGANLNLLTSISFDVVIPWTPRAERGV